LAGFLLLVIATIKRPLIYSLATWQYAIATFTQIGFHRSQLTAFVFAVN
jgi:hypothetical protein